MCGGRLTRNSVLSVDGCGPLYLIRSGVTIHELSAFDLTLRTHQSTSLPTATMPAMKTVRNGMLYCENSTDDTIELDAFNPFRGHRDVCNSHWTTC